MSTSKTKDAPLLDPMLCISPKHPHRRSPHEKTVALGFILTSILFERIAYYSLVANLSATLEASEILDWSSRYGITAQMIFSGNQQRGLKRRVMFACVL